MAKSIFILGLCSLLAAPLAWSAAYYCTDSNRLVSTGMLADEVIQACGQPTHSKTETVQPVVDRKLINQWVYLSKQKRAPWDKSVLPELTISFYENQVVGIAVNGQDVPGSINCFGRGYIQPGDFSNKVVKLCGKPDAYQNQIKTVKGPQQTKRTLTYSRPNGLPPVSFEFLDDKLVDIRYGG